MIGIQTALHQVEETAITVFPTRTQFTLGRCVPCRGRWTLVAPGLFYRRADGRDVTIPACAMHHEAFVQYVHRVAMRASMAQAAEEWS